VGMSESVYQIRAPHFTAGVVLMGDRVQTAAPIVRYMIGWHIDRVRGYCTHKRWSVDRAC
jgi:hypothetical protein